MVMGMARMVMDMAPTVIPPTSIDAPMPIDPPTLMPATIVHECMAGVDLVGVAGVGGAGGGGGS